MQAHEDRIDPSTGQDVTLATNPALADYWTTMDPVRDYAALALAQARKRSEKDEHPETLRHIVGLREGWEQALAATSQSQPQSLADDDEGQP